MTKFPSRTTKTSLRGFFLYMSTAVLKTLCQIAENSSRSVSGRNSWLRKTGMRLHSKGISEWFGSALCIFFSVRSFTEHRERTSIDSDNCDTIISLSLGLIVAYQKLICSIVTKKEGMYDHNNTTDK